MAAERPEGKAPFLEHLEELRSRLIRCFVAIFVGFVLCYAVKDRIFGVLVSPLIKSIPGEHAQHLIYTAPQEAFLVYMKMAFVCGIFLAMPYIIFEFWRFVAPGLYEHEKRYLIPIVIISILFFASGIAFGYFIALPFGFQFFTSFASDYVTPLISTKEFLSFTLKLLFSFGIIFELPVVIFFLAKLGIIDSIMLRRYRRFAILVIFIVAAIITPPDALSQIIAAVPLLVLYELGVWVAHFSGRRTGCRVEEDSEKGIIKAK
ncbi:MAG: twin-arginine translocase subunit TatC [Syntrophobacterales bacterium]|nr:twin-arginine translocase subunit TatC [Syntrophobacterales bacterium]